MVENQTKVSLPTPWLVLAPAACILPFGIVGNVLTLITVLNKRCKKTSFIVVIAALAITDTIVLVSFPLNTLSRNSTVFLCKFSKFCVNYSRHISVWLVVALTLEITFAVYCPSKVKDVCVPKTGFIVVAIVIAILFASDAHILFGITSITFENKTECGFTNTRFETFYLFFFPWIDLTIGLILPAIVIVASNSAILVRVFKSTAALTCTTTTGTNRRDKNKQLLRMTLLVSIVFLILYLPRLLYIVSRPYIYELSDTAFAFANETDANLSAVLANLAMLNHGINFMLYIFSGKRFRNELRKALCRSPATVAPDLRIRNLQTNARVTRRNSDATNERPTKQANYQCEERKSNETEIENRKNERMFDEQNEETAVFS